MKKKDHFYAELGRRVRYMRRIRGLSTKSMAAEIGVDLRSLQRYETGELKFTPLLLDRCARLLEVSVGFFYNENERAPIPANNNRLGYMVAAEALRLPNDTIRNNIVHLMRSINDNWPED